MTDLMARQRVVGDGQFDVAADANAVLIHETQRHERFGIVVLREILKRLQRPGVLLDGAVIEAFGLVVWPGDGRKGGSHQHRGGGELQIRVHLLLPCEQRLSLWCKRPGDCICAMWHGGSTQIKTNALIPHTT
ncbi:MULTISPECIES: hypothetical protein [Achromobacter]|uniref:hypothetical protein n=1 Tax=Achromobacter TaxID=222 RepID=UPI0020C5F7DF|nr:MULTISPECIES: hypothetical protein [Achromobacter]